MNTPKFQKVMDQLNEGLLNKDTSQERRKFDPTVFREVKDTLLNMCRGKCAYCESKIGAASYGDVENFRPKSGAKGLNNKYSREHYYWLAYDWDNLLIACQICNSKYKRDYFPLEDETRRARIGARGSELLQEGALLIDPCLDNPQEHLEFTANGYVRELTAKGKATIDILGLNRAGLVESRRLAGQQLMDKLEIMRFTSDFTNTFTTNFVAYINELFSPYPTQEYAALLRALFEDWNEEYSNLWSAVQKAQKTAMQRPKQSRSVIGNEHTNDEIVSVAAQLTTIKRFSIRSVSIENFKSIEKLDLNILPVNDTKESWLLVLGDNGIGKSSILQAITLALLSRNELDRLKLDVLDFLKKGATTGKIAIQSYEHDTPVVLTMDKNGFHTTLENALTFVLAYGSTRLLPKGGIQPDKGTEPYFNVKNLFDYSTALSDPNIWLNSIDAEEFDKRVAPVFFDVLALKGEDRLWLQDGRINIQQYGENIELEDNSDGYKTITALLTDIMKTLSIDAANYHSTQGIVLIDEIGNHLHPRWRIKITSALRRAFPNLQFIVSTHEPLCLRGLAYGEVVVMLRDEKNAVRVLDKELLPDHSAMRIEQLLTSDLFGLIDVMDEQVEKTYEEYYRLLSKKEEDRTDEDHAKIKELSDQLSKKEILGNTPKEQALYKFLGETYDSMRQGDDGFKTTEQLKEATVKKVKDILSEQNLDWL